MCNKNSYSLSSAMNPEYKAVLSCLSTAVTLLASPAVDLNSFGLALVSDGFLTESALDNILSTLGLSSNQKARELLQCVSVHVKTNPKKYYESYIKVLESCPPLYTLLDKIRKEYGEKLNIFTHSFMLS